MALSGILLVGFVVAHMVGNLKAFLGPEALNAYAGFLRDVGEPLFPRELLLWIFRIVMLAAIIIHVAMAYQLTRRDLSGRPVHYANKKMLQASFASSTMRWGGLIILFFVIYHLLHLTGGMVGWGTTPFIHESAEGFSTYQNVVNAFQSWPATLFYILAMGALGMHLYHGVWSMVQTLGLNGKRFNAFWQGLSVAVAIVCFCGFISVPLAVLLGFVR